MKELRAKIKENGVWRKWSVEWKKERNSEKKTAESEKERESDIQRERNKKWKDTEI